MFIRLPKGRKLIIIIIKIARTYITPAYAIDFAVPNLSKSIPPVMFPIRPPTPNIDPIRPTLVRASLVSRKAA